MCGLESWWLVQNKTTRLIGLYSLSVLVGPISRVLASQAQEMAQADRKHMALEDFDLGLPQAFSDTQNISIFYF
jgi:hypothetical protein